MLEASGLGLRADGNWLWRKLNLQLNSGSRLGIRGKSGSGKSSLLRCLAGLVEADEGSIQYRQQPLAQWFMPAYRSEVMYLPADPLVLDGTVRGNLQAPFQLESHRQRQFDAGRISDWLQALNRETAFLERGTTNLSSGERQILALLRVLQLEPHVLLLDEATASLDPDSERCAESLLEQWIRERPGRAWIMVSHSDEQLDRISNVQMDLSGA